MSGNVSGSIMSKNVVHHSFQHSFVVHGNHNVHCKDNVEYETFGHCYMIKNAIETGNFYKHNLAMNIQLLDVLIFGENNNEASRFWISNPQN